MVQTEPNITNEIRASGKKPLTKNTKIKNGNENGNSMQAILRFYAHKECTVVVAKRERRLLSILEL